MGLIGSFHDPLTEFILAFIAAIWLKRFGSVMDADLDAEIKSVPKWDAIWFPFFADYTDQPQPD